MLTLYPFLLQASWPTVHPLVLTLVVASLTFLATWYWKIYDAKRTQEKTESQAIADLKMKQQTDILKIEGTLGIIVSTLDRFAGTAEAQATITERVAGQGQKIDEARQEISSLRATITPQIAKLQSDLEHLRNV